MLLLYSKRARSNADTFEVVGTETATIGKQNSNPADRGDNVQSSETKAIFVLKEGDGSSTEEKNAKPF